MSKFQIPGLLGAALGAAGMFATSAIVLADSAQAWRGPSGGGAAAGPRGAVAVGPGGGAAAAGPRGAVAVGPQGGAAAAGPRGAVAVGPAGGAAAVSRPGYRPAQPIYRPPVAVAPVPVYPRYGYPAAPVAGAVAVGVVAGATAAAVASAAAPQQTTVIVTNPAPEPLVIGATLVVLPGGCRSTTVRGTGYYQCGGAWVRPYMQGSRVTYVVVPPP